MCGALFSLIISIYYPPYILGRFKAHYQDQEIRTDVILAVLARKPSEPYDFHKRVVAVDSFLSSSAAPSLVAANKRVSNILTKLTTEIPNNINSNILKESQEKSLAECIISLKSELKEYFDNKDYGTILSKLSSLKEWWILWTNKDKSFSDTIKSQKFILKCSGYFSIANVIIILLLIISVPTWHTFMKPLYLTTKEHTVTIINSYTPSSIFLLSHKFFSNWKSISCIFTNWNSHSIDSH